MATITTAGGASSGNFACAPNAVTVSAAILTTPSAAGPPDTASMIYFVRIEIFPDPLIEVALESAPAQNSETIPGSVQVNLATKQHGGVQYRKVGPNTPIYIMARNRGLTSKNVYWTYEYVGIKVA